MVINFTRIILRAFITLFFLYPSAYCFAEDAQSDAIWFVNLLKDNVGKTFCAPSNLTVNDAANAVSAFSKAHPEFNDRLNDYQTIQALAEAYPCNKDIPPPTQSAHESNVTSININEKGNLDYDNNIGCIPLKKVKNTLTPPDLYKGVSECISQDKNDLAIGLFMLAGSYATFDANRVSDISAGQAKQVLIMNTFATIPQDKKTKFYTALKGMLNNPDLHKELCSDVQKIGSPNYYPKYMILHGIKAFTGDPYKDAIVKDFDASSAWKNIQTNYLICPS